MNWKPKICNYSDPTKSALTKQNEKMSIKHFKAWPLQWIFTSKLNVNSRTSVNRAKDKMKREKTMKEVSSSSAQKQMSWILQQVCFDHRSIKQGPMNQSLCLIVALSRLQAGVAMNRSPQRRRVCPLTRTSVHRTTEKALITSHI